MAPQCFGSRMFTGRAHGGADHVHIEAWACHKEWQLTLSQAWGQQDKAASYCTLIVVMSSRMSRLPECWGFYNLKVPELRVLACHTDYRVLWFQNVAQLLTLLQAWGKRAQLLLMAHLCTYSYECWNVSVLECLWHVTGSWMLCF